MQPAFNPDAPKVDQSNGPGAPTPASRFNDINSRGRIQVGATVADAISEYKAGNFTREDLKQLAFGMGCQIVEGRDTQALVAKIAELEKENGELKHRAVIAESAFASAKAELDAAAPTKRRTAKGQSE